MRTLFIIGATLCSVKPYCLVIPASIVRYLFSLASALQITLKEVAVPPFGGVYRLAELEQEYLRKYIEEMLDKGLIRTSSSRAASPVLFVKKKSPDAKEELRVCVDYRRLNEMSIKDRYPLPSTDMLLDHLNGTVIHTKIDLRWAYHRIRIAEGDEWKTAFRTRYGLFEWLVMPFRLSNAPAVFQRLLQDVLREYLDVFVIVYIDNILIYSEDESLHAGHVLQVLKRLRENSLYAKLSKCDFSVKYCEYLVFKIYPDGITMDSRKVDTVLTWPAPTNVRGVRGFLGFANLYRRFIQDYSTIAAPIYQLLKKDKVYEWTEPHQKAFDDLKARFTSAPRIESSAELKAGNKVWLSAEHILTTCPTKKFADRRLGPFTIIALVGSHACRLLLPPLMSRIHPVFHFAYLEPAKPNTIAGRRPPPPGRIELAEQDNKYEVSAILDRKKI